MARVDGFETDVPLLMIYWYSGLSTPSNVIVLDSTVVFPVDMDDKKHLDAFRFEIRNARTVSTNSTVNRTFAAPKKARDAWMYAISQALLMYEKANDKARKAAANEIRKVHPMPFSARPKSSSYDVWPSSRPRNASSSNTQQCPDKPRMESKATSPLPRNPKSHALIRPGQKTMERSTTI